jgi:hypothetical protein
MQQQRLAGKLRDCALDKMSAGLKVIDRDSAFCQQPSRQIEIGHGKCDHSAIPAFTTNDHRYNGDKE